LCTVKTPQHTTTRCNTLVACLKTERTVTPFPNTLQHAPQHTAAHCITLQHTATHLRHVSRSNVPWLPCSICVAVCCSVLQCVAVFWQCNAVHCSVLRSVLHCVAVRKVSPPHCTSLQHTATHCNTPQHTATRCNAGTVTPFPHASDGCMDVFVIQAQNHFSLASLYATVDPRGSHLKDKRFHFYKAVEYVTPPFFFHRTTSLLPLSKTMGWLRLGDTLKILGLFCKRALSIKETIFSKRDL